MNKHSATDIFRSITHSTAAPDPTHAVSYWYSDGEQLNFISESVLMPNGDLVVVTSDLDALNSCGEAFSVTHVLSVTYSMNTPTIHVKSSHTPEQADDFDFPTTDAYYDRKQGAIESDLAMSAIEKRLDADYVNFTLDMMEFTRRSRAAKA